MNSCFIRFKCLFMMGHNTEIDERQNFLLLTAPNKRRLLGKVARDCPWGQGSSKLEL